MRRPIVASACAALLLALTACATGGPMTEPAPTTPSSRPSFERSTPGPIFPSGEPVAVPPAKWEAIADDLARRGVTGDPVLLSSEAVTWTNGALGCPQPGNSYTQSLVEGMRIVVSVDGTSYDYRFGTGDSPVLCER
jgi:hypothetical protein